MFTHPTPALVGWNHPQASKREDLVKILRELPLRELRAILAKIERVKARRAKAKASKPAKRAK